MSALVQKLAEIQGKMVVPKSEYNKHGKYPYRTAEGIIAKYKSLGFTNISLVMTDDMVGVGGRVFLIAKATLHMDGEEFSVTGCAQHATQQKGMNDAQITGSTSSYARKYALCGLFAIDDESQDPDGKDNRAENHNSQREPEPTPADIRDSLKARFAKSNPDGLKAAWETNAELRLAIAALPAPMRFELRTAAMGVVGGDLPEINPEGAGA